MPDLEKKIVIPVEADTSPAETKIKKTKKDASKQGVEIPVKIDTSEITKALNSIQGLLGKMSKAFDKDVKFSGLQKGLDDVYNKINKLVRENKKGISYINVNPLGLDGMKENISEMTRNIQSLNNTKINSDSFEKLASVLENIETLVNSIVKGMNFDAIRPSNQIQEDIESTTEKLEKLAKTEEKINKLEKYLNNTGVKQGKNIIEWGDSEEVSERTLENIIKKMKEYISLGGDLSKIKFKAFNADTQIKELYSLADVLEILEDEGKIDFVDESGISNDMSSIQNLRKELSELNKELIEAKNRENRDLNVSLDTKSVEEFSIAISKAVEKIGELHFDIPEDFTFDGLSVENLDRIIGKMDEMVVTIKNIGTLLSTGVDTSNLNIKELEIDVDPKVDSEEFVKKIEQQLKDSIVKIKADLKLFDDGKNNDYAIINNEAITGIKSTFKDITDDFGFNLQTETSGIQENLKETLAQINYESLFSSLRETLLDIVTQFQNSLQSVNFSSSQLDEAYKTIKGWNDADSYASQKANITGGERGAFLNSKTGAISNSFLVDAEGSFRNVLFNALKDLSAGVNGEISSVYDTWVHSHPFRKSIEGLKAIGSDVGFSVSDLELGVEKLLKDELPNMLLTNNYKFSSLDLSGVSEEITNKFIEEYKKELLKAGLEEVTIAGKKKIVFPSNLAKHDGVYDLDSKSDILNGAMLNAMSNVGLDASRFKTGNIEDLKVDLSALQQEEQNVISETEKLLNVLEKLDSVLSSSDNAFKLGISEESLNGIIGKLDEIVKTLEKIGGISSNLDIDSETGSNFKDYELSQYKEIQETQTALQKYKMTMAEIDKLKLEPDTEHYKKALEELILLAEKYKQEILEASHGNLLDTGRINPANNYDLTKVKEEAELIAKLAQDLRTNRFQINDIDISSLTSIKNIIEMIEKSEKQTFDSLNPELKASEKYVKDLKYALITIAAANDELQISPKDSASLKDLENVAKRLPELQKFMNITGEFDGDAFNLVNSDEWNQFLSTLPKAQKYLESINYQPENIVDTTSIYGKTRAFQEEGQVVQKVVQEEKNDLESLENKLGEVTDAVDLKTRAFREEEQVVIGTVQSEINNLEVLDGQLLEIIGTIEKLQSTPVNIDTKLFDNESENTENNLSKILSELDEKVKGIDLESLTKISTALKDFNIPNKTAENLLNVAIALTEFKTSFSGISTGDNQLLNTINSIVSRTDELKDLVKVLESSTKKIKEFSDVTGDKLSEGRSDDKPKSPKKTDKKEKAIDNSKSMLSSFKEYISGSEMLGTAFSNASSKVEDLNNELQNGTLSLANYNNEVKIVKFSLDEIKKSNTMLTNFKQSIGDDIDLSTAFSNASSKVEKLNNELQDGALSLQDYRKQITEIKKSLNATQDAVAFADADGIEAGKEAMRKYALEVSQGKANLDSAKISANKLTVEWEDQNGVIQKLEVNYDELTRAITAMQTQQGKSVKETKTLSEAFKQGWSNVKQYVVSFMGFYEIINAVRNGITVIRDLDTALTEMRKVSDESLSSLKNFQVESFDIAGEIGSTAKQIQESAADFMRLGYSLQEASQLSADANIYANVGDMEIEEATEHMISSIKAWESEFSSEVEASGAIIDKYNEIGNNFAISSADIGSAMERSAAALKAGGNTLDESLGLIVAGGLYCLKFVETHFYRTHLIARIA